jgi:hypothetical protein
MRRLCPIEPTPFIIKYACIYGRGQRRIRIGIPFQDFSYIPYDERFLMMKGEAKDGDS